MKQLVPREHCYSFHIHVALATAHQCSLQLPHSDARPFSALAAIAAALIADSFVLVGCTQQTYASRVRMHVQVQCSTTAVWFVESASAVLAFVTLLLHYVRMALRRNGDALCWCPLRARLYRHMCCVKVCYKCKHDGKNSRAWKPDDGI